MAKGKVAHRNNVSTYFTFSAMLNYLPDAATAQILYTRYPCVRSSQYYINCMIIEAQNLYRRTGHSLRTYFVRIHGIGIKIGILSPKISAKHPPYFLSISRLLQSWVDVLCLPCARTACILDISLGVPVLLMYLLPAHQGSPHPQIPA